jgi:hypothetical protein
VREQTSKGKNDDEFGLPLVLTDDESGLLDVPTNGE